jgi:hypothetical protein
MLGIVRGLLDHGGYLADPEFIAWLGSGTQDVLQVKDIAWGRFFAGLQQDGLDGMLTSLRSLMDETGAAEGLPVMVREQAQRAAIARAAGPKRVQPRRLPRRQRHAR